jgi:16S rRNA (uracil1498-N3)-methyltransferase
MSTRLFVSDPLSNDAELILQGEQARYLGRVLRSRVGDIISVFNGDAGEWSANIENISKSTVTLRIGQHRETTTESPLKIHLVQGISRGERMDFVIQKATELGVKRITPVLTNHGMVKLDEQRAEKRRLHWQQVATSACEQSGRTRPPLVDSPIDLNKWFGNKGPADSTELFLKPGAKTAFASVDKPTQKVCLLIGPEGGLSERECEDAVVAGFTAVSLGPRILRTETAAMAAITLAQSSWGDLK